MKQMQKYNSNIMFTKLYLLTFLKLSNKKGSIIFVLFFCLVLNLINKFLCY